MYKPELNDIKNICPAVKVHIDLLRVADRLLSQSKMFVRFLSEHRTGKNWCCLMILS